MMAREATSEEKLLKLIRQKNKSGRSGQNEQEPSHHPAIRDRAKKKEFRLLDAGSAVLLVLSIGFAAYILVNYVLVNGNDDKMSLLPGMEPPGGDVMTKRAVLPDMKPFSVYEEKFAQRDIFQLPEQKKETASVAPKKLEPDLSKQLKIVGIVLDQDSKVIVEDVKSKQTFFMSVGERVGDAVLEQILDDRVIFDYNDKKVELVP